MATNSRVRIRQATPADVDAIVDIHFTAFDEDVMNQLMYPGGVSADSRQKFGSRVLPQTAAVKSATDTTAPREQNFVFVAEYLPEDGPGEVVAFAKWLLHREPRTEEERRAQVFNAKPEIFGQGCDLDVVNAFIGGMNRLQWDNAKGEASLYLGILACSPTRQRLGAGSALLKWGLDLADGLGLPCRLEASPTGYGLYKKFDFEDLDALDIKVTETYGVANTNGRNWGTNHGVAVAGRIPEGVHRTVIMRRPPKKASVETMYATSRPAA